ncbi:hypothetical protein HMN09_00398900 [Mycena chlorophos]|uniref:Uncharacterized protein n=1 Tax=Mycena chlorophos TaxID=658473 RepID=A0A8H6TH77_MYCCL|nr:hypothetical protein HMN09_00398900 [Mycena chlorophos]
MRPVHLLLLLAAALGGYAQSNSTSDAGVSGTGVSGSSLPTSSQPPTSSDPPTTSSAPPTTTSAPPTTSDPPLTQPPVSPPPTSGGGTVTVTTTSTSSATQSGNATNTAGADQATTTNANTGSTGLSTGGIAGLAAAGGVAVLCLIGFFVWKLTRSRGGDFDDNEAIKWPELNAHGDPSGGTSNALPVSNTGRAGFDPGNDLSRVPSAANTFSNSTTDFHSDDPYAVPPLPHMNPGQPYRDDPNAMNTAGYYDPYNGPVPQTFNEAHGAPPPEWGGNEAIPMNQLPGRASPGPQMAYAGAGRTPSPGPQMAYAGAGRTPSPGPQQAYGQAYGRASPAPQQAYGGGY